MIKENLRDFSDFIRSKGVMGLAIGIIIGAAVTATVQSLVNDIINPILGMLMVEGNLERATLRIGHSEIRWGNFISTLIDLIIIAAVVYFGTKWLKLDKLDKKEEKDKKKA